jgi:hypothetical protein
MRYLFIYRPGEDSDARPTPKQIEEMTAFIGDAFKTGKLIATDGLMASKHGALVSINNGKIAVTDGPFTETKEIIGGYAIMNLGSKEEAVEEAKKFLKLMGRGTSEVRRMGDPPPQG